MVLPQKSREKGLLINKKVSYFQPQRPDPQKRRSSLVNTIWLLVLGFVVLIALVFIASTFFPGLFGKCIAIVKISNELNAEGIPSSLFYKGEPSSADIANAIKKLDFRSDVVGVVFIINSPGGSIVATQEIYDAIKNLSKPKIAYLRELAASGAYYISTGTNYIISDSNTITGSIGVVATFSEMSSLFDKLGLNITVIKSGSYKDIGSSLRPMSEEEKEIIQSIVNELFEEFKSIVLENRGEKLNKVKFNEIFDGRILTGKQAKVIGLVDELGNKHDAIAKVAEMAGMKEEPAICEISTMPASNALFNLEGFLRSFIKEKSELKISYE